MIRVKTEAEFKQSGLMTDWDFPRNWNSSGAMAYLYGKELDPLYYSIIPEMSFRIHRNLANDMVVPADPSNLSWVLLPEDLIEETDIDF